MTSSLERISIIIPAYNEEAVIGKVLDELRQEINPYELIVVDDGSADATAEVAAEHGATVVAHPDNIGNGAAIKTGIRHASGDIIVMMDSDGQHPPSVLPSLLEHIERYDMVVGARTHESDSKFYRDVGNQVFNTYASYITDNDIPDLTSGFRVVRANIARSLVYLLPNGFSYPTTITIAMFRSGYRIKYVPFAAPQRVGVSKIRPIRDGLRFMLTITRLAVMFVPLKIFIPASLVFLTVGVAYGAYQLIFLSIFRNFATMLIILGIIIFLNGLIAEQIALSNLRESSKVSEGH